MTIAWVIGSGGLLGTALCKALRRQGAALFCPEERFIWSDEEALRSQMAIAVRAFAAQANSSDSWALYWAAGIGAMSIAEDALAPETRALQALLQLLAGEPQLMAAQGSIAFASSAGAIYAGSSDVINTEDTTPAPTTAYAREKLKQEELLRAFADDVNQKTVLIARVSTIYGPGQARGKQQGLLSHIARRVLRNQPIQIYVPFDTIRDYIAVDDAAAAMVSALSLASCRAGVHIKIIASEKPTTIAEIISVFRRIARRTPLIITSANKMSSLYSRRVQFRSVVLAGDVQPVGKSLSVGIAQLMMAERTNLVSNAHKSMTTGR